MNFLIICDDMETSEIRSLFYFTFPFLSVLEKHSWASFGDSLRIAPLSRSESAAAFSLHFRPVLRCASWCLEPRRWRARALTVDVD